MNTFIKKKIKKILPWTGPLAEKIRIYNFYKKMDRDDNIYAKNYKNKALQSLQFEDSFYLINDKTGFDIKYQENKIYNLKLVAKNINGIVIKPGEVFSFWQLARDANKNNPYKEGLVLINGELTTAPAGGLCHISNLLCWLFLHSPLNFLERVGHKSREFPNPSDMLIGIDATIMEGLVDLKVKNNSPYSYQIFIDFDHDHMIGKIYTNNPTPYKYEIVNRNLNYFEKNGEIFEKVDIYQNIYKNDNLIDSLFLYQNTCHIGYRINEELICKGA